MHENELMHYGVPGMKWGVRRDRNNGSALTSVGRKRISEKAGLYMNPGYRDKNAVNRKAVSKEYVRKYDKLMKKYGIDTEQMDAYEAARKLEKKTGEKQLDDKLWNSLLDKYADATLKDIGYENIEGAKEYVKELFSRDLAYIED